MISCSTKDMTDRQGFQQPLRCDPTAATGRADSDRCSGLKGLDVQATYNFSLPYVKTLQADGLTYAPAAI